VPSQSKRASADHIVQPFHCTEEEIALFIRLIQQSNSVHSGGLDSRVRAAYWLASHYEDDALVGIAALKKPRMGYRDSVFQRAMVGEHAGAFAMELGWVYTVEQWRGYGIARGLAEKLLARVPAEAVFATTGLDNPGMQHILREYHFHTMGKPFLGRDQQSLLQLWTRNG
jgi:GNAT superfamily N-acetyltransferase